MAKLPGIIVIISLCIVQCVIIVAKVIMYKYLLDYLDSHEHHFPHSSPKSSLPYHNQFQHTESLDSDDHHQKCVNK